MKLKLFMLNTLLLCAVSLWTLSCKEDTHEVPNDPAKLPVVIIAQNVDYITSSSAISGGTVTDDKGQTVTSRGVCWSSTINPTLKDSVSKDGSGVGMFTSNLRNLLPSTSYYVRAYATNAAGTAYSSAKHFTTFALPTVTTTLVSGITSGSAKSGGEVNDYYTGQYITARGVCWSAVPNPTVNLMTKTSNGTGIGTFTSTITRLAVNTTYYVRAYVTCAGGTSYGSEMQFTTSTNTIQYVSIPAGTFTMGSPTSEVKRSFDETQFEVTLSAFRMSKCEITNAQYTAFLNAKGIGSDGLYAAGTYPTQPLIYTSSGSTDWGLQYIDGQWVPVAGCENMPVINVTWYAAAEFATYAGGTLPTEAQWEYACRAGTTTPFNTGNFLTNLQANYNWRYPYNDGINTVTISPQKLQAVGTYPANAWGLCDMHGNAWEWCNDWYATYPTTAQTNPTGAVTMWVRVIRGGDCYIEAEECRSAIRKRGYPSLGGVGFRVVLLQ